MPGRADGWDGLAAWYGTYVFDGAAGQTAGGSPITYHYTVILRRTAGGPACELHLEGYQQDDKLHCTAEGQHNVLAVAFASYANGALANANGVQVYQPGALLFRLTRPDTGGDGRLMTTWLALHPDGMAQAGVFFRRTGG